MIQLLHKSHNPVLIVGAVTIVTVSILVIAKSIAYFYSDSAAVLSSLIDSISDIGLSLVTFMSLRLSLKPADEDHRYGHGKVEGVSALLQAAFLTGSAAFIFFTALGRFIQPEAMHDHMISMALMSLSLVASVMLSFIQNKAKTASGSLAMAADHAHYATDVWMNGSVILVVWLDYMNLAPTWLDPLAAIAIAGLFAKAACGIGLNAIDMLMDREVESDVHQKILSLICAPKEVHGVHDLRCIRSGMKMFISLDLEVDGNQSLVTAHEIGRETEYRILKEFPQAEIIIHLDPHDDTEDTRHNVDAP